MSLFYRFIRRLVRTLFQICYRHRIYGLENLPKGRAILAPNHVSHLDPCVLGISMPTEIHFLGRDTLFDGFILRNLIKRLNCHPINRDGGDLKSIRQILSLLNEDKQIVIFPEGTRSANGELQEAKEGLATIALRAKAAIVPIYVAGTFEAWGRQRGKPHLSGRTACIFGKPLYSEAYADYPKREAPGILTRDLMAAIADLRTQFEAGAYAKRSKVKQLKKRT